MFHVTTVLKMLVHAANLFSLSNWEREREREREILKIGLLYTEQEKCSCKPILLNEKIPDLTQAFPLDTESH